ncbi:hypothetical protein Pst134EA_007768 [Puccinia striiformis f. sp. tritici]|uniref:DUF6589 domain-containing protein n=3 Tax=Puccinia striiformis TaxID=27350 RepID=A0A0L0VJ39_9BASI|nr:hypothetical protein Pst134EA_007768 [Puccinia striiformis f. sp. tritici]KAH9470516.1 hypothetical protein Pst134EA_007768 [Puccinia striiformis f. sp. tritici]KNE98974.1 hypothetical protein PSTG_07818 [Puccinia striiformis f. sp. tritici PST-78]
MQDNTPKNLPSLRKMGEKLVFIDKVMHAYGLGLKSFIHAFLANDYPEINSNRRLWGAPIGWRSTREVLDDIKRLVHQTTEGKNRWKQYILSEAQVILAAEGGAHGQFPKGNYHNSKTLTTEFFSDQSKATRTAKLVTEDMPFLYNLILHKVRKNSPEKPTQALEKTNLEDNPESEDNLAVASDSDTSSESDTDTRPVTTKRQTPLAKKTAVEEVEDCEEPFDQANRPHVIAATICSIVAFSANRRDNALQIQNAVVSLACGVTERVSTYLNYIGLASSRKTAHRAISSLGRLAEGTIIKKMGSKKLPMAPVICLDNLDFEEKIHEKSVEKTTQMFHGTWGYLHVPDKQLIDRYNPANFSLESYQEAIRESSNMDVKPSWFLPDFNSSAHFQAVLKSQITRVLLDHIATPADKKHPLQKDPPVIDPIAIKKPDFTMFKLMIASDNSSEGVSQVLEGFLRQTKLSAKEFYSRLQVLEGDLATCMNLECLRAQRKPSGRAENSLSGIFSLLGASHVLWNFAQAIFILHFGNPSDSNDLGAWHTLSSLGIPSERPTTKKDFTLMLTHMTKCHEATIIHCLLTVMKFPKALLPEEKVKIPSERLHRIVDLCYMRFFSPAALRAASIDPKTGGLKNALLRLRDFASIIECDRAMRAGDIGRVLNMWKRWTVMAHGIKGLNNYVIYLPRMILLLTKVLPKGLAKTLQHSLLINPTGRANHFVAKDFFLENNNFWLKFFYNHSGIGTEISRLKDVFSLNIPILRELVQGIKGDSGKSVIYQSHKHRLTVNSINEYLQMAQQHSILSESAAHQSKTVDIYKAGSAALHSDYKQHKKKLNRMRPSTVLLYQTSTGPLEEADLFDEDDNKDEMDP